jgi:DNA polymerase-1
LRPRSGGAVASARPEPPPGNTLQRVPAPLLIADVPWLLYRAYFALPDSITGTDGQSVNALLGTANALLAAAEAFHPRAVVACMGAEEAEYRVSLYTAYHAHRDPMPRALAEQWSRATSFLSAFGWFVPGSDRLEADDVMYSYATLESQAGGRALLMTADRDLYGAVDQQVAVIEQQRGGGAFAELGPEQVRERYGVDPALVPDFIALRGDPSDGLPGAPGVGAKTAAELLRAHGSLEAALAAAVGEPAIGTATMRPRIAAALSENAELLRAFKQIATLQRIEVERPPDRPTDYERGAAAARELGMNALAKRLGELA